MNYAQYDAYVRDRMAAHAMKAANAALYHDAVAVEAEAVGNEAVAKYHREMAENKRVKVAGLADMLIDVNAAMGVHAA